MQAYTAAPICAIFPTRAPTVALVPVSIETKPNILQNLNIEHWIADGVEVEATRTTPPSAKVVKLWDENHHFGIDYNYIIYYTPQGKPFIPSNRSMRLLTSNVLDDWYGNIVVVKADRNDYVADISERELGLIEYIVSR